MHLVLSVRDLVRQIPAEWQENVKHRAQLSYAAFLEQITDPERASRIGAWFWGVQEVPDILDRWGQDLDPAHVHVVTVPPPGGAPELLWKRFSQAFGLDGIDLDLEGERQNPSLGVPETTLLRRINRKANAELPPADYRPLVRELLAHQTLSRRTRSPRLALPPDLHTWAQEVSGTWIAEVERRGYDVVGDLGDLVGRPAGHRVRRSGPAPRAPGRRRRAWTRSPRCCSTTRGCATRSSGCTRSSPTCAARWSGRTRRRRTGCVAASTCGSSAAGWARCCWAPTAARAAGARGRRSGRPSTWRRRRRRGR